MKTTKLLLAALLATATTAPAFAASDEGTSVESRTKADLNIVKQQNAKSTADNTISSASKARAANEDWFTEGQYASDKTSEISRQTFEDRFAQLDENGDGTITEAERLQNLSWYSEGGLDANNDGKITRAEYNARFKAFDKNGDGRISVNERLNATEPASGKR